MSKHKKAADVGAVPSQPVDIDAAADRIGRAIHETADADALAVIKAIDPENPLSDFPDPPEVIPDPKGGPAAEVVATEAPPATGATPGSPSDAFVATHELEPGDGMAYPLRLMGLDLFVDPAGKEWTRGEVEKRGALRRVVPQ